MCPSLKSHSGQGRQILDAQSLPPSPLGAAPRRGVFHAQSCDHCQPQLAPVSSCGGCVWADVRACVRVCARVDDLAEASMRCWPSSSAPRRAIISARCGPRGDYRLLATPASPPPCLFSHFSFSPACPAWVFSVLPLPLPTTSSHPSTPHQPKSTGKPGWTMLGGTQL